VGEQERQEQLERIHHEVIDIVTNKLVDSKTKRMYTSGMIEKALDQLSSQAAHLPQVEKSEGANVENGEEKEKAKPKWTGVVATKSAKSQALFAMKALIAHQPLPVMRARMKLRVICPMQVLKHNVKLAPKAQDAGQAGDGAPKAKGTVKDFILGFVEEVETEDTAGDEWEVVGFVEPGLYKELTAFVETQTKGRARVEVLDMAVVHEDD
jgi:ribosome maturation protein SDO1